MAVHPSLGVDNIRYGVPRPADGVVPLRQFCQQRGHFRLVFKEKLDVVAAGKAQVAVAVLVGDFADLPDVLC